MHFHKMAEEGNANALLNVIPSWIEQQRKAIANRFVIGTNQPAQCTYTGTDHKRARAGEAGFHPHALLASQRTLTTRSRPQIRMPLNQGPTNMDNILYWQALKAAFKDEQGKIATEASTREQMEDVFSDHDEVNAPDDSYAATEVRTLRQLLRQIQAHEGAAYAKLRDAFELNYKRAEVAHRDPSGAEIMGYSTDFEGYPQIVKDCVLKGLVDPTARMDTWCITLHSQILDSIDALETETPPATAEDYDHWLGGQPAAIDHPILQDLAAAARQEA